MADCGVFLEDQFQVLAAACMYALFYVGRAEYLRVKWFVTRAMCLLVLIQSICTQELISRIN